MVESGGEVVLPVACRLSSIGRWRWGGHDCLGVRALVVPTSLYSRCDRGPNPERFGLPRSGSRVKGGVEINLTISPLISSLFFSFLFPYLISS